jgi:hypothetical protein
MPDFDIKKNDLRMFPEAIVTDAIQALDARVSLRNTAIRFFS